MPFSRNILKNVIFVPTFLQDCVPLNIETCTNFYYLSVNSSNILYKGDSKVNSILFPVVDLFVCLYILGFSSHCRIFYSYGDVTFAGERLQILPCAWHAQPLSSEGPIACPTYCDTGNPFIMVIFKDPWHSHLLPSVFCVFFQYLLIYFLFNFHSILYSANIHLKQQDIHQHRTYK